MRKAITLQYYGSGKASLKYGPETAYATQVAGVKTAINSIVSNGTGSGYTTFWEIWVGGGSTKRYHANYKTVSLPNYTWDVAFGVAANVKNQTA